MREIKWIFYTIVFTILQNGFAQKDALFFKHITNVNGLSSNRINAILEDGDSFIWFATGDGLDMYDGNSVMHFNKEVTCMAQHPVTKSPLIGTATGLEVFDKNTYSFKRINAKSKDGLELNPININTLYVGHDNQIFAAALNALYLFNQATTNFKTYLLPKDRNGKHLEVTSLCIIQKDHVLLGTKSGLYQLNLKTGIFSEIYKDLYLGLVSKLFVDSNLNLWICTYSKGLGFVKNGNLQTPPIFYKQENGILLNNRVVDIVECQDQEFLIANIEGGLVQLDKKNMQVKHYLPDIHNTNSISSKALTALLKDSQDNVWIGTYNSGVDLIDKHRKKFEHYQVNFRDNGLFNNNIRAMFQDSQGNIWIGTKEGGGLSKFNRAEGTFKHYRPNPNDPTSLGDDYVLAIQELDETHLMIGTLKNGLEIFNKKSGKFSHNTFNNNAIFNRVYTIHKDLNNRIWMDYGGVFYEFLPQSLTIEKVDGVKRVKCIINQDQDHIWLGTLESGLYLFNTKTKQLEKKLIDDTQINALQKDSKGNLWVGTKKGLFLKNKNSETFIKYTINEGLSNNQVLGLLVDANDNVWLSTTNGLSKYDTTTLKFKNYDVYDGLQGNEFERYVALKTQDGELLFGGRNGFNIFHPNDISENHNTPKVVIKDFLLFNKPVQIGAKNSPLKQHISHTEQLTLNHQQSVITFGFIALNYTSPEKNKYAYKLEGFDKDWNFIGNKKEATYTNLPPNTYVFKVKASNADNFWNEQGASIKINVQPPWWKTSWAYLAYFMAAIIFLIAFYQLTYVYINLKNNLKLEQFEKENNKQLLQAKLQFFTNISHEFRTPLTLIIVPLEKLLSASTNDTNLQKHLQLINANANRLLRLINQLMDFRKIEKGKMQLKVGKYNVVEVTRKISESFNSKAEESSINFQVIVPTDEINVYFDLEKYDIILYNLIYNAFKFTDNFGSIKVEIKIIEVEGKNSTVEISVSDNGKGIPKEDIDRIFEEFYQIEQGHKGTGIGLTLTKKMVELHHGTLRVESAQGKGSCFIVSLPLGKAHFKTDYIFELPSDSAYKTEEYQLENSDNDFLESSIENPNKIKSTKILLVEDNEELRLYLKDTLQDSYKIYEAKDGKEGIKVCLQVSPDLIISDVMMPNMNGVDMCRNIKTDVRISHIPIILLTAKSSFDHKIEGLKTGADAYIVKPFNMRLLEVQVINILESRRKLKERFVKDININPKEISSSTADDRFLEKAIKIVENHIDESEFTVNDFMAEIGMSRSSLHLKLKALTNKSTTAFIRSIKLRTAAVLLRETDQTISEIAYKTGFSSSTYFSKCFRQVFGKLPTEYRNN